MQELGSGTTSVTGDIKDEQLLWWCGGSWREVGRVVGGVEAHCTRCVDYRCVFSWYTSSRARSSWAQLTAASSGSGIGSVMVLASAVGGRLDCIDWERSPGAVLEAAELCTPFADVESSSRSASGSTASITITSIAAPPDGGAWRAAPVAAGSDRAWRCPRQAYGDRSRFRTRVAFGHPSPRQRPLIHGELHSRHRPRALPSAARSPSGVRSIGAGRTARVFP